MAENKISLLEPFWKSMLAACAPLLVFWVGVEFFIDPPFWNYWHHWELTYYYTSMDLVDNLPVHIASGPGTPMQVLGAGLLSLIGTSPTDYPLFLRLGHALILLMVIFGVWLFQRYAFDREQRFLSVVCVWLYFGFGSALVYLRVWIPEALYFPFGVLFFLSLLRILSSSGKPDPLSVLAAGAALGAIISVKFNALPWVPALFVVLLLPANYSLKTRIKNLLYAALGMLTTFLILTYPVRDHYEYMVKLLIGFALTDGVSSPGEVTGISVPALIENWQAFIIDCWPATAFLAVVLFFYFSLLRKGSIARKDSKIVNAMLVFTMISTLLSLITISRMYTDRYMLPVGFCWLMLLTVLVKSMSSHMTQKSKNLLVIGGLAVLSTAAIQAWGETQRQKIDYSNQYDAIESAISEFSHRYENQRPVIIFGWPVPHPAASMRHQPFYESHQRSLDPLYPEAGTWVSWRHAVRLPNGETQWDLAVLPVEAFKLVEKNPVAIVNDLENGDVIAYFGNFKILRQVDRWVILAPNPETE